MTGQRIRKGQGSIYVKVAATGENRRMMRECALMAAIATSRLPSGTASRLDAGKHVNCFSHFNLFFNPLKNSSPPTLQVKE